MANVFQKLLDYIGVETEEVDETEQEQQEELYETPQAEPVKQRTREKRNYATNGNVVSMPNIAVNKMVIYRPVSYEDTQNIIDNLKNRKPVIVNMENIEVEVAQRILDFISGACYAVDGRVHKVSSRIFVVAPATYDVIGNSDGSRE